MFDRLFGPNQDRPAAGLLLAFSPPNSQAQNAFSFTGCMAFLSFSSSAHHHVHAYFLLLFHAELLHPSTSRSASYIPHHPISIPFFFLTSLPHESLAFTQASTVVCPSHLHVSFVCSFTFLPHKYQPLTRDLLPSTCGLLLTASSPGLLTNLADLPTASCMAVFSAPTTYN